MVSQDWEREVTPLQAVIENTIDENKRLLRTVEAFAALQPIYFKCLFSYVMFFVSLVNAYDSFYEELNQLNRQSFLQVKHDKKPKPTEYIQKVRRIRNFSIAHMPSKKASAVDSAAAANWQPMTLRGKSGEVYDLNEMTFGAARLTARDSTGKVVKQSSDFEIKGIPELDQLCSVYLDEYDLICSDYLSKIHSRLPITVGDEHYSEFEV